MTATNKYRAYFTLRGDFDPAEVTAHLGISPSSSWKRGDVNPRTQLERTRSRWSLESRLEESDSLEAQVADVLDQLRPYGDRVKQFGGDGEALMQLVAYLHTNYPGFSLDAAVLAELGELQLGLDCDFYYLYSDKREDSE